MGLTPLNPSAATGMREASDTMSPSSSSVTGLRVDLAPRPIAVAAANSKMVLASARAAYEGGFFIPVLIGDVAQIERHAREIAWDLGECRLIGAADDVACAVVAAELVRRREASAIMKGNLHTDILLTAVLDKKVGLRTNRRLSHVYRMTDPHSSRAFLITDSGVNVAPDVATKVDIVRNAVDMAHALGNMKPRVAILSAIEKPTPKMPSSIAAREVRDQILASDLACYIDGPLALDNAVSNTAAAMKHLDSAVAGQADILVVHDIETGNALSKMMVHMMGAVAAGVVLGSTVPLIVNSRTDPIEARLASIEVAHKLAVWQVNNSWLD